MQLSRLAARLLLDQCRGDEIWSVALCRSHAIPESWIEDLADCFESGFRRDVETIYLESQVTNQFHGVRDRDLAFRLAEFLGIDSAQATSLASHGRAEVLALQQAVEEG